MSSSSARTPAAASRVIMPSSNNKRTNVTKKKVEVPVTYVELDESDMESWHSSCYDSDALQDMDPCYICGSARGGNTMYQCSYCLEHVHIACYNRVHGTALVGHPPRPWACRNVKACTRLGADRKRQRFMFDGPGFIEDEPDYSEEEEEEEEEEVHFPPFIWHPGMDRKADQQNRPPPSSSSASLKNSCGARSSSVLTQQQPNRATSQPTTKSGSSQMAGKTSSSVPQQQQQRKPTSEDVARKVIKSEPVQGISKKISAAKPSTEIATSATAVGAAVTGVAVAKVAAATVADCRPAASQQPNHRGGRPSAVGDVQTPASVPAQQQQHVRTATSSNATSESSILNRHVILASSSSVAQQQQQQQQRAAAPQEGAAPVNRPPVSEAEKANIAREFQAHYAQKQNAVMTPYEKILCQAAQDIAQAGYTDAVLKEELTELLTLAFRPALRELLMFYGITQISPSECGKSVKDSLSQILLDLLADLTPLRFRAQFRLLVGPVLTNLVQKYVTNVNQLLVNVPSRALGVDTTWYR